MSTTKRESAKKINEIQGKVQDIFFDLEEFSEHDTADAAQSSAIKLMDDISSIRKRILQNGKNDEQ